MPWRARPAPSWSKRPTNHKGPEARFLALVQAIRRNYRPEARFGDIEVWRYDASTASLFGPESSNRKIFP